MIDTIPIPVPIKENGITKQRSFLGIFGKKKESSSPPLKFPSQPDHQNNIDRDLHALHDRERTDLEKMEKLEQHMKDFDLEIEKPETSGQDLAPRPPHEMRNSPDKEVNLADLEALEVNMEKTRDLPVFSLPEPPKPKQPLVIAPVQKKTEQDTKIMFSPQQQKPMVMPLPPSHAQLRPEQHIAPLLPASPALPEPKPTLLPPQPIIIVKGKPQSIIPPLPQTSITVKPRARVEKYFHHLEKERQRIHNDIKQVITKPQEELKPEHFFMLKNGKPLKNLRELIEALKTIDDETFTHHVNDHRNDFANWIRDILKKEQLAQDIRNKRVKTELLTILTQHERDIEHNIHKEKDEFLKGKHEQLALIDKVKNAREELYRMQADLVTRQKRLEIREKAVQRANAFDVDSYKKRMQSWYGKKEKDLLTNVQRRAVQVQKEKEELAKQADAFAKKEAVTNKLEREYRKNLALVDADKKKTAHQQLRLEKLENELFEKTKATKEQQAVFNKKEQELKAWESRLQQRESKLQQELQEDTQLQKTLSDARQKLSEEKDTMEKEGFKQYLTSELQQDFIQHPTELTNISGQLDVVETKYGDLFMQIKNCRRMLNQGRVADAQRLYNELKQDFSKRKLPPTEKEKIFNDIKLLYDDIHLSAMHTEV